MLTSPKAALAVVAVVLACGVLAGGCSSGEREYYRVRDPNSGRVFYTKDMGQHTSGAVTLVDGATGQRITLQESEVKPISKQTYYTSRMTSGQNPQEVAAAEGRAAGARAAEVRAAREKAAADAKAGEAQAAEAKVPATAPATAPASATPEAPPADSSEASAPQTVPAPQPPAPGQ